MNYIESEMVCAVLEMERETKEIICRYTGRKLGEIGQKPRGFDPAEMPEFDTENEISSAIGEDARESFDMMRLCGRGLVRSSTLIWEGDD